MMGYLLTFLGDLRRPCTETEVKNVGDVHLSYMPFSLLHSNHGWYGIIGVAYYRQRLLNYPDIGVAVGIGILSHLIF